MFTAREKQLIIDALDNRHAAITEHIDWLREKGLDTTEMLAPFKNERKLIGPLMDKVNTSLPTGAE